MSKLSSFKRHLKPEKVWLAKQVEEEKLKIARQVVLDRAKKDAQFAADVLKAVGENLPKEIKEACEESVAGEKTKALVEKWEKTGLLEGTGSRSTDTAILIESQSKELIPEATRPIVGGDLTHELTETIQLDGGGEILVRPEEVLGYPTDGPNSAIDLPEKLVQEEGPKAEKA